MPSSILPVDFSDISSKSISDVNGGCPKISTVGAYKKNLRQITPLENLKYINLAFKKSVQNDSNLVIINNLPIDLASC